jgi:hypothetical protein
MEPDPSSHPANGEVAHMSLDRLSNAKNEGFSDPQAANEVDDTPESGPNAVCQQMLYHEKF